MFATAARIADRQHGRISRRQLLAAGVDRTRIERWLQDGRIRRMHTGVYAVGHAAPSLDARYMAAVLAGGDGAVLSHRAAAYKLALLRGTPPRPEVTVPTSAHRRRSNHLAYTYGDVIERGAATAAELRPLLTYRAAARAAANSSATAGSM